MTTKYYFGYYRWAGQAKPTCVVEEDGHSVGGEVKFIDGTKTEINETQWTLCTLDNLKSLHPFKEDDTPSS